jgi:hypothetical protein
MGFAINGICFDPFFGDAMEDESYQRRLRAVVQNRLSLLYNATKEGNAEKDY